MRKLTNDELNRPSVEEFQRQPKIPVVVVLDNIRSMQNVGAFFRTSDAFAVERLILCGITATPPARDIHK
ncbi:MAG: TrmH family RNA methyltransferase, partial [Alistipes sp.]|nr:TrmH family RNA methyltransferase [Alistipes sp.]